MVAQTARLATIMTQELMRTRGSGATFGGNYFNFVILKHTSTFELRWVKRRIMPVTAFVTQAAAATLSLVPSLRIACYCYCYFIVIVIVIVIKDRLDLRALRAQPQGNVHALGNVS